MHKVSRLAVSAVALGGGLLLAAPVSAQEVTSTPCPYPFVNCPTPSPSTPPTTAPPTTTPPTTAPPTTAPPTESPSPTTSPIGGGGGGPSTEEPPTETPAPGGGIGGGGGGPAVVDHSPVRGSTGGAASLPFTGGEVTLIALTGAAALGGGLVLLAAGRKRATA